MRSSLVAQWVKDPALSLLRLGVTAVSRVQSLTGKLPHARGTAKKKKKRERERAMGFGVRGPEPKSYLHLLQVV